MFLVVVNAYFYGKECSEIFWRHWDGFYRWNASLSSLLDDEFGVFVRKNDVIVFKKYRKTFSFIAFNFVNSERILWCFFLLFVWEKIICFERIKASNDVHFCIYCLRFYENIMTKNHSNYDCFLVIIRWCFLQKKNGIKLSNMMCSLAMKLWKIMGLSHFYLWCNRKI